MRRELLAYWKTLDFDEIKIFKTTVKLIKY